MRQHKKDSFVKVMIGVIRDIWHVNTLYPSLEWRDNYGSIINIHYDARPDVIPRIMGHYLQREDCVELALLRFISNREFHTPNTLLFPAMRFYELPVPQPSVKLVNRGDKKVGRRSLRLM